MTTFQEAAVVPFHGHQLLTIRDGETIRVAMRPICEAIGLDWSAQLRRINRHPVLAEGVAMMATPSDGGSQETFTLPLDFLNGWLFGINASRVKPELQERLIEYQRECFGALAAYWQQGIATNPRARAATVPQLLSTQRHVNGLLKLLKQERNPTIRRHLHGQIEQDCRLLALPCPELDQIGHDELPAWEDPLIDEFWELLDVLLDGKDSRQLNHSRGSRRIALNLPEVARAAAIAKLDIPDLSDLRRALKHSRSPRFIKIKPVNSKHHCRTVRCWVFELAECHTAATAKG